MRMIIMKGRMRRISPSFKIILIYCLISVLLIFIYCRWSSYLDDEFSERQVQKETGNEIRLPVDEQKNDVLESPQLVEIIQDFPEPETQIKPLDEIRPPIIDERKDDELEPPQVVPEIPRQEKTRSFVIDYDNDVFLKDGEPFYYVSGEIHYFRAKRERWKDLLQKHRAAGLNCISMYVEWSSHEKKPGDYQFSGDNDIEYFLDLAMETDLLVILRPGPYICAERDFGGFPSWLVTHYPRVKIRTNDPDYLREVQKWFNVLFLRLKRYLYGNNGPIIMVQVENEYGSYKACNMEYRLWLRDEMKKHVGDAAVLFTTDMPRDKMLECGTIPGVYATVDFGTRGNATQKFAKMRTYSPRGPLVNSEFYPGWLDHWEEPMQRRTTESVLAMMKQLLELRANFNFYMFYGGTNYGFMNGANSVPSSGVYQPDITSYDYDAPLDEAGDPTPKYFAIRDLLSEQGYCDIPDDYTLEPEPKGNYGKVLLKPVLSVFNTSYIEDRITFTSPQPKTFEEMGLQYGYALYESTIPMNMSGLVTLFVPGLRDRCGVYLDNLFVGNLSRMKNIYNITFHVKAKQKLSLLVENQGRINFNDMNDPKGLLSAPTLNDHRLVGWTITGLPFERISWISKLSTVDSVASPMFYLGELDLPPQATPLDTYIDPTGWGKGIIFVNECHLGRYWPQVGPQITLYVPASCLRAAPEKNTIILFETDHVPSTQEIIFTDKPKLDGLNVTT